MQLLTLALQGRALVALQDAGSQREVKGTNPCWPCPECPWLNWMPVCFSVTSMNQSFIYSFITRDSSTSANPRLVGSAAHYSMFVVLQQLQFRCAVQVCMVPFHEWEDAVDQDAVQEYLLVKICQAACYSQEAV